MDAQIPEATVTMVRVAAIDLSVLYNFMPLITDPPGEQMMKRHGRLLSPSMRCQRLSTSTACSTDSLVMVSVKWNALLRPLDAPSQDSLSTSRPYAILALADSISAVWLSTNCPSVCDLKYSA